MKRLPLPLKCVSLLYGAFSALAFAYLVLALSVVVPSAGPIGLIVAVEPLLLALSYGLAAWSLYRNLKWSRWLFALIAVVDFAVLVWLAPLAFKAYEHYINPPLDAYVVLSASKLLQILADLYAGRVLRFAISFVCACAVLWHFRQHQKNAA